MKNFIKTPIKFFLKNNSYVFNTNSIQIKIKKNVNMLDSNYDYYLYSFFIKKNFNPFLKNDSNNFKKKSFINSFLQNSFRFGNKLKFLSFFNKMRLNFYMLFFKKYEFFQKKFPTYNIFYNFSKTESKFFDFNFLLNLIIKNNESIFQSKAIRINKKIKQKNKTKLKYSVDIQYITSNKRPLFILKQIHMYSNYYNFYNYDERLLMSFFNIFFLEKNSDIYKNKIFIYKNLLKKNSK